MSYEPNYFTDKVKRAQKKLFDLLLKQYSTKAELANVLDIHVSKLSRCVALKDPISYNLVVKISSLVNGKVMPHDLRPDIFKTELYKLYQK